MTKDATASKDAALRAVGRTVVNFQRLEHNLKLAARLGPVEGTLPKVQRDAEKRTERATTMTLGQAIQAWLCAAARESPTSSYTPDLFDATLQMTFSLDVDTASQDAHGTALKGLLEARNKLVHDDLARFPWDSPDECDRLVTDLDKVNEAIRVQLDFITAILGAVRAIDPKDIELAQEEPSTQIAREAPWKATPNSLPDRSRER